MTIDINFWVYFELPAAPANCFEMENAGEMNKGPGSSDPMLEDHAWAEAFLRRANHIMQRSDFQQMIWTFGRLKRGALAATEAFDELQELLKQYESLQDQLELLCASPPSSKHFNIPLHLRKYSEWWTEPKTKESKQPPPVLADDYIPHNLLYKVDSRFASYPHTQFDLVKDTPLTEPDDSDLTFPRGDVTSTEFVKGIAALVRIAPIHCFRCPSYLHVLAATDRFSISGRSMCR